MILRTVLVLMAAAGAVFAEGRTILAAGAHAGDMEVAAGAVLLKHAKLGDRVVLLHLTLGERGNPKLSPAAYGEQKRREAVEVAKALGAEALFGPYRDGELPNDEEARRYVAGVIRREKPTHIITHWRTSIHKDHSNAHAVVTDAVLLAALEGVEPGGAPHRGVRGVYFTENWEDPEEFKPFLYVDVSEHLAGWKEAVARYEFVRGGISSFPYLEYYEALARVRGAESSARYAEAFEVGPLGKKRVVATLP